MRIALLSDIHGNLPALEAVLSDIETRGGVDEYWILGDLVAIGPQPVEVIERLSPLSNARLTRGNTDRYVASGDRPLPALYDIEDERFFVRMAVFNEAFAWTQGAVTARGWLAFLDALPLETRTTLPDGTRLLGVHASPGQDDGEGIHPHLSDDALTDRLNGAAADLICVGHTHWPLKRQAGNSYVVNVGSLSNPCIANLKATYVLLEADANGYVLRHFQVDYDREAVIALAIARRFPALDYLAELLRGAKPGVRRPSPQTCSLG